MEQNEQQIEMANNIRENITDKLLPQKDNQQPKSILKTRKVKLNIPDDSKASKNTRRFKASNNNQNNTNQDNTNQNNTNQDNANQNSQITNQNAPITQTKTIPNINQNYQFNILGVGISHSTMYFIYVIIAIGVIYYIYTMYDTTRLQQQNTNQQNSQNI